MTEVDRRTLFGEYERRSSTLVKATGAAEKLGLDQPRLSIPPASRVKPEITVQHEVVNHVE